MAYATIADLVTRFGERQVIQLTDRAATGVMDDVVAQKALDDAAGVVDGYLSGRYSLPMSPVPTILVGCACDLARYALYPDAVPETVQKRADEARDYLTRIGNGTLKLGVQPDPPSNDSAGTVQMVTGRDRTWIGL